MSMDAAVLIGRISTYLALLPLTACFLVASAGLLMRWEGPEPDGWILAVAFSVSFVIDAFADRLALAGLNNHWLMYVGAPVQFGLFMAVFTPGKARRIAAAAFGLVVILSWLRNTFLSPETIIRTLAGTWVAFVAWKHTSRFRGPVLVYCGLAIPFLLAMGFFTPSLTGPWVYAWVPYLVIRMIALAWMSGLLILSPEAPDARVRGPAAIGGPVHARDRAYDSGRDHRHPVFAGPQIQGRAHGKPH